MHNLENQIAQKAEQKDTSSLVWHEYGQLMEEMIVLYEEENRLFDEGFSLTMPDTTEAKKSLVARQNMLIAMLREKEDERKNITPQFAAHIRERNEVLMVAMDQNVKYSESSIKAVNGLMGRYKKTATKKMQSVHYGANAQVENGVFRPAFALNQVV